MELKEIWMVLCNMVDNFRTKTTFVNGSRSVGANCYENQFVVLSFLSF